MQQAVNTMILFFYNSTVCIIHQKTKSTTRTITCPYSLSFLSKFSLKLKDRILVLFLYNVNTPDSEQLNLENMDSNKFSVIRELFLVVILLLAFAVAISREVGNCQCHTSRIVCLVK